MKKLLLVNVADDWLKAGGDRPSLGTLYIASYVRETCAGDVSVIDMNHHSPADLVQRVKDFKPDYVGLSMTTPQYRVGKNLAYGIKAAFPDVPLIAGGPHVTAVNGDVDSVFNIVAVGECETAVAKFLSETHPSPTGRTILKGSASLGLDKTLDWLPMPARDLVDMDKYSLKIAGLPATTLMTQRGCLRAGTQITMAHGTQRPIEHVQVGDEVLSWDAKRECFTSKPVMAIWSREADDLWEITFKNGAVLYITSEHPLLTQRGWVSVYDAEEGESIAAMPAVQEAVCSPSMPCASEVLRSTLQVAVATGASEYEVAGSWSREASANSQRYDCRTKVKILGASTYTKCASKAHTFDNKAWRPQPGKTSRSSNENLKDIEEGMACATVCTGQAALETRQDATSMGKTTGRQTKRCGSVFARAHSANQSSIRVCGRRASLDRTLLIGQAQKSRLHQQRATQSYSVARRAMAFGQGRHNSRAGLCDSRMAMSHGLVRPAQAKAKTGIAATSPVIWQTILSKRFIGKSHVHNITVHPLHNYVANGVVVHNCPYKCVFCSEPVLNKTFKGHSVDYTVREMEHVRDAYGAKALIIYDDVFVLSWQRTEALCKAMIERQVGLKYRATTRAHDLIRRPQLVELLRESGCVELCLGVESGSDEVLKISDKGMTVATNREAIKRIKSGGIKCLSYLITGLPGMSADTEKASLDFMIDADVDELGWYLFAPFPSTPAWLQRDKFGLTIYEEDIRRDEWDITQVKAKPEDVTCYIAYLEQGLSRERIKELWLDNLSKWRAHAESRGKKSIQVEDINAA